MNRRHVIAIPAAVAVASLVAACAGTKPPVPIPTNSDQVFADIDAAIATASALVDVAAGWGVGPDTIAGARALIAKARAYEAQAKSALGTGAWKDLADLALRVLTGIVFAPAPLAAGAPAPGVRAVEAPPLTMTLRRAG